MKLLIAAAAVATLAIAAPAAAEVYGVASYTVATGQGATFGAIAGKVGYRFNPYLGVEAEGAVGVADDNVTLQGVPVKVSLSHNVGGYGVALWPVSPKLDLFARLGYGNVKFKASALGNEASGDNSGWAAGVGGQYFVTAKDGVRVEYARLDNASLDTWSIGYVRKF